MSALPAILSPSLSALVKPRSAFGRVVSQTTCGGKTGKARPNPLHLPLPSNLPQGECAIQRKSPAHGGAGKSELEGKLSRASTPWRNVPDKRQLAGRRRASRQFLEQFGAPLDRSIF